VFMAVISAAARTIAQAMRWVNETLPPSTAVRAALIERLAIAAHLRPIENAAYVPSKLSCRLGPCHVELPARRYRLFQH
jgi:hypothetical protein